MICLELKWFFTDPCRIFQFLNLCGRYVLRPSVRVVSKNFLPLDATDRSKISSNRHRIFFYVSIYPLSLFANTPFNLHRSMGCFILCSAVLFCASRQPALASCVKVSAVLILIFCAYTVKDLTKVIKGYRSEWDIPLFKWRVFWNNVCSPFFTSKMSPIFETRPSGIESLFSLFPISSNT